MPKQDKKRNVNSQYQRLTGQDTQSYGSTKQSQPFQLQQIQFSRANASSSSEEGSQSFYSKLPNLREPERELHIPNQVNPDPHHELFHVATGNQGLEYRPAGGDRSGSTIPGVIFSTLFWPFVRHVVPAGKIWMSTDNGQPVVLGPGEHFIVSPFHSRDREISFGVAYDIPLHPTLRVINVPANHLAAASNNGEYVTLTPGRHVLLGAGWAIEPAVHITDNNINLGRYSIITVGVGQVGVVQFAGAVISLAPGRHIIDNTRERFDKFVNLNEKRFTIGNVTCVRIDDGEVGISYNNGKLDVLHSGWHVLTAPQQTYKGTVSTRQRCAALHQVTVSTYDNVRIKNSSDVFYAIENIDILLENVDISTAKNDKELEDIIKTDVVARAEMTLNKIFKRHLFSEMQQTSTANESSSAKRKEKEEVGANENLSQRVNHELDEELRENLHKIGINLVSLGATNLELEDKDLQKQLTDQAASVAKATAELAAQRSAGQVAIQKAEIQAQTTTITANAAAEKLKIESDARKQQEKTEAEILNIRAEASRNAAEKDAQGQAALARVLEDNPNYAEIRKIEAQGKAVGEALRGADRPVIVTEGSLNTGFGFFGGKSAAQELLPQRLPHALPQAARNDGESASQAVRALGG